MLPFVDAARDYALSNPQQVIAVVTALAGVLFHYKKTGKLPLGRLPWRRLRQTLRDLRDRYFNRRRPRGVPGIVVAAGQDQFEAALRRHYFEYPPMSYDYRGEDVNLRRPANVSPHPITGETVFMELHARAFETETGELFVIAHREPNRYEETDLHLSHSGMVSYEKGRASLATVLDDTSLSYEKVSSEKDSGVTVV